MDTSVHHIHRSIELVQCMQLTDSTWIRISETSPSIRNHQLDGSTKAHRRLTKTPCPLAYMQPSDRHHIASYLIHSCHKEEKKVSEGWLEYSRFSLLGTRDISWWRPDPDEARIRDTSELGRWKRRLDRSSSGDGLSVSRSSQAVWMHAAKGMRKWQSAGLIRIQVADLFRIALV
jgi:hypothetical protein